MVHNVKAGSVDHIWPVRMTFYNYLYSCDLTPAMDGQYIPAKGGHSHWLFQSIQLMCESTLSFPTEYQQC